MSDLNHKAILTQVRDDNDEYVDYLNIYEKVNGEELGSQPYKLVEHYSGKKLIRKFWLSIRMQKVHWNWRGIR